MATACKVGETTFEAAWASVESWLDWVIFTVTFIYRFERGLESAKFDDEVAICRTNSLRFVTA